MEWTFAKSTKTCSSCDKDLTKEDFFFSSLVLSETKVKNDQFSRKDYCPFCWDNKPAGVFSYWKTKLDKVASKTPREVLVEFFENLINPDKENTVNVDENSIPKIVYLFSLILLRRKILKIKENIKKGEQAFLVFERVPDGKLYEVPEVNISDDELVSLREQFSRLFLFDI